MAFPAETAMAVYTPVSSDLLRPLAHALGLTLEGQPEPVAAGIENSTYFFTATTGGASGRYVLTLVEMADPDQIRYAARLAVRLADCGLPVPAPLADGFGERIHTLAGKPALIFPRVPGSHPDPVTESHCAVIGDFLARADGLPGPLPNRRGVDWLTAATGDLAPLLADPDGDLLTDQIARYRHLVATGSGMPTGAIHGDLFHDNCLFEGNQLRGVIDFYNACHDWLLLDLAIAVSDWCAGEDGHLDPARYSALVNAYCQARPVTREEIAQWPTMLAIAATRFWVSRLLGRAGLLKGAGHAADKDPGEYRRKLLAMLGAPPSLG